MSSDEVQATAHGEIIAISGWRSDLEGGDTFHLDKPQVQILYALAEADELALNHEGLYEVLRGSPAKRFTRDKPLTPEREWRVEEYLAPLYDLELVEQHPEGERPKLTTAGLKLITWLTRSWRGWSAYSQAVGISHF